MNCLNRVEVQAYIDNELSADRMKEVEEHLCSCRSCRDLHIYALMDRDLVNSLLNDLTSEINSTATEFKYPGTKKERHITRYVIAFTAAASLLIFIFLLPKSSDIVTEEAPEVEKIVKEFYEGKDLNKMWHENSQILILQDADGNIESVVTN